MTNTEFANMALKIAENYKTLYVLGGIGSPLTDARKEQVIKNYKYNEKRSAKIRAASKDTCAFDCVGLIKSILWGWNGSLNKAHGGATYNSNNVPDVGADAMIKKCSNISTDFSNIKVGEMVWMSGHCGIYAGNGVVVESTPSWKDGVQKTTLKQRNWIKHGQLPWVTYPTVTNKNISLVKGTSIKLNKTPVYTSAYDKKSVSCLSGLYYIYDGVCINKRYRITVKLSYVGKKPTGKYVTAFVDVKDLT